VATILTILLNARDAGDFSGASVEWEMAAGDLVGLRPASPKVRCVRGYNCLRFMDRLGSGGVVGRLGLGLVPVTDI